MNTRRTLLKALGALVALPSLSLAQAGNKLIVYKGPACGCCGEWEKHMRLAGFALDSRIVPDPARVRRTLGVPDSFASCHTATVRGYVVEGHVPAEDVKRLLRERPKAIGLAVPGMPQGAPGMEQGRSEPYQTLAFDARRSWLFQQH